MDIQIGYNAEGYIESVLVNGALHNVDNLDIGVRVEVEINIGRNFKYLPLHCSRVTLGSCPEICKICGQVWIRFEYLSDRCIHIV